MTQIPISNYTLRELADMHEPLTKVRVAATNRLSAKERGVDESPSPLLVASDPLVEKFVEAHEMLEAMIATKFLEHPVHQFMLSVPGVRCVLACRILGIIADITKFERFSNLRTFCGITPGKNKLIKGQPAHFSRRLKTSLYVVWSSMLKVDKVLSERKRPPKMYVEIYQNWRKIYAHRFGTGQCSKKKNGHDSEGNPYTTPDKPEGFTRFVEDLRLDRAKEVGRNDEGHVLYTAEIGGPEFTEEQIGTWAQDWSDKRQMLAAKNKLLDVFLFHLFEVWRAAEGMPAPTLYSHERLGHHAKFEKEDFTSEILRQDKLKEVEAMIRRYKQRYALA